MSRLLRLCATPLGTALALSGAAVLLAGCGERPTVVPAGTMAARAPAPVANEAPPIHLNVALQGSTMLCADLQRQASVWLLYGARGAVKERQADGRQRDGVRFEIGSFVTGNHRTGFQFERDQPPRLMRQTTSDGGAAELLDASDADAPAMRCFRSLGDEFIWVDAHLAQAAAPLTGAWRCDGPIGRFTAQPGGRVVVDQGPPGQLFVWARKGQQHLTMFFAGPPASTPGAAPGFGRFIDAAVALPSSSQSEWRYQPSDKASGGPWRCVRETL